MTPGHALIIMAVVLVAITVLRVSYYRRVSAWLIIPSFVVAAAGAIILILYGLS